MKKHTFEYVKQYFEDHGCELLEEEYKGVNIKMKYKCSCGNISEICFNKFKMGRRCSICGKNKRHIIREVKQYFKDNNCELLEKEYINNKILMKYRCSCENISKISFSNFKKGHRCNKCGLKKLSEGNKLLHKDVKQYFKDHGCKLLETNYSGYHTPMKYKCSCGNISKINFSNFKKGQRCKKCANPGYSKESQILFNTVYTKLNKRQKNKTYYATLNNEFGINYNGKCFKYDYVNSKSKKVIEYNGSAWHAKPSLKDRDVGWFAFNKAKTAKEARDYEKIKYEGLEKRGYQILTVWDYESHKDFDTLVQKCLDFLTT